MKIPVALFVKVETFSMVGKLQQGKSEKVQSHSTLLDYSYLYLIDPAKFLNFTLQNLWLLIQVLLDVTEMVFQPWKPGTSRDPAPEKCPLITKFKSKSQNLLLKCDEEPLPVRMESDLQRKIEDIFCLLAQSLFGRHCQVLAKPIFLCS